MTAVSSKQQMKKVCPPGRMWFRLNCAVGAFSQMVPLLSMLVNVQARKQSPALPIDLSDHTPFQLLLEQRSDTSGAASYNPACHWALMLCVANAYQ